MKKVSGKRLNKAHQYDSKKLPTAAKKSMFLTFNFDSETD
jgi:hypothetical protein